MMMYEESLRVPSLIRYPQEITAGTINSDLVINLDYAPTFLEYAGLPVPEDMQGRSLVSLLTGKTPNDWRTIFYYQHFDIQPDGELANCGVRTKDFKLICYNHNYDHFQLFDLIVDPRETKDVSKDPEYEITARRMKTRLREEREKVGLTDEAEATIFCSDGVAETRVQMVALLADIDANTARLAQ